MDKVIYFDEPAKTDNLDKQGSKEIELAEELINKWREQEINDDLVVCETCIYSALGKHNFTGKREDYCTMVPMKDGINKKTINKVTGESVFVSVHRDFFCWKNPRHRRTITIPASKYKPLDIKNIKRPQTTQEKFLSEGFKMIHSCVFIKKLDDNKSCCRLFCNMCGEYINEQTRVIDKDTTIEVYCSSCESRNNYFIRKGVN